MSVLQHFLLVLLLAGSILRASSQKLATEQDPKCLLPKDPGPCRMRLNRFYYNPQTNACEEFTFGGCRGNENKFGFRQTCEEACIRPQAVAKGSSTTATTSATGAATSTTTTMKPVAAVAATGAVAIPTTTSGATTKATN